MIVSHRSTGFNTALCHSGLHWCTDRVVATEYRQGLCPHLVQQRLLASALSVFSVQQVVVPDRNTDQRS